MANQQKLVFEISANADDAIRDLGIIKTSLKDLSRTSTRTASSTKKIEKEFGGLQKSLSGVTGKLKAVTIGLASLGTAMKAVEFAKMAADADQAGEAFDKIVTEMGKNSIEVFEEIKRASKGLIPDAELKQSAVTAVSLGVPLEKLAQLMDVAVAKSREMGTTASQAFADLATGIGRGSPMILDNLGLTIKLGDANEKLAKHLGKTVEQLTSQEKTLALTNAVIEAAGGAVDRYADSGLTAAQSMQEFDAQVENLKVKIGQQLMPAITDAAKAATEFLKSLDDSELVRFAKNMKPLVSSMWDFAKASAEATSRSPYMPDNPIKAYNDTVDAFQRLIDIIDLTFNEQERLNQALDDSKGVLGRYAASIDLPKKGVIEYKRAIESAINGLVAYRNKLESLDPEHKDLNKSFTEIDKTLNKLGDALYGVNKKLEENETVTKKAAKAATIYSEKELEALRKTNDRRLKDYESMTDRLRDKESKLVDDIRKLNEKLASDLKRIENDRIRRMDTIDEKIRKLGQSGKGDYRKYVEDQKAAEEELAKAKEALAAKNFDLYRYYAGRYEQLVTEYAGQEIKENDQIRVSKEATARAGIEGLKQVKALEEKYYAEKKRLAKDAHDEAVRAKKAELVSVRAQLKATNQLIEAVKKLGELLTGKKIDVNTSDAQKQIKELDAMINGLDASLQEPQKVRVDADTSGIERAEQRYEQTKRVMEYNGIKVEVDADTTPADLGIEQFITSEDGKVVTIETNPEWQKAQDALDEFRARQESDPIRQKVAIDVKPAEKEVDTIQRKAEAKPVTVRADADTSVADVKIGKLKEPIATTLKINVDAARAKAVIESLKVPTSSTHTVYVKTVQARAAGGPIGLSSGGRIPGYDPHGSDDVPAMLTRGEYVINADAVRLYGEALFSALNAKILPADALRVPTRTVSPPPSNRLASGGIASPGPAREININFNTGSETLTVSADEATAEKLARYLRKYT